MSAPNFSQATILAAGDQLQNTFNSMPQNIVNALQRADFVQEIAGIRAQIIANATALYPILTTERETEPPLVLIPELLIVTTGTGVNIQAAVLQQRAGALGVIPSNHTVNKDVLIKGPNEATTGKALQGLLDYTQNLLSLKWGEYMKVPLGLDPVNGPNGGGHYRKT